MNREVLPTVRLRKKFHLVISSKCRNALPHCSESLGECCI